jgi:hypothetical protein
MKRFVTTLVVFWVAFLSAPSLPAQAKLDRRTAVDVTAAAPHDVYGSLARALGCKLVIAPEITQPVTMRLENVTVGTALTALSESLGCRWTLDGNTLRIDPAASEKPGPAGVTGGVPGGVKGGVTGGVRGGVAGGVPGGVVGGVPGGGFAGTDFKQRLERKTPANFRFVDVPLRTIMGALGKIADLEIRVDDPSPEHVTIDLGNRTILSAFKAIQEETGLRTGAVFVATLPGSDKKLQMKVGSSKED